MRCNVWIYFPVGAPFTHKKIGKSSPLKREEKETFPVYVATIVFSEKADFMHLNQWPTAFPLRAIKREGRWRIPSLGNSPCAVTFKLQKERMLLGMSFGKAFNRLCCWKALRPSLTALFIAKGGWNTPDPVVSCYNRRISFWRLQEAEIRYATFLDCHSSGCILLQWFDFGCCFRFCEGNRRTGVFHLLWIGLYHNPGVLKLWVSIHFVRD